MNTAVDIKHSPLRWNDLIELKPLLDEGAMNFPLHASETYYRSRAFVSQIGINPLIAASAPLFFLIEQIRHLKNTPDIHKLHQDFMHEVQAFEHQAQSHDYKSYIIMAARYVLCIWIDQTILNTAWGEKSGWKKIRLTDISESEEENPFYLLLNRCIKEPAIYIDLLELFYVCLSLGFEATRKTNSSEANSFRLTETRDHLFEMIQRQKKHCPTQLEIDTTEKIHKSSFTIKSLLKPSLFILTCLFLTGIYLVMSYHLDNLING